MSGSAPADHSLLPQQFFYDSSGAGKLWVGVPPAVNASGKLLFLDVADVQNKVPIGGGTMTGPLVLNADPTNLLGAATKQYVDGKVSSATYPYLPLTGGTLAGPGNLTVNGIVQLGMSGNTATIIVGAAATTTLGTLSFQVVGTKQINFQQGSSNRWRFQVGGTESGSNAGSDVSLTRYSDAGGSLGNALTITRSTGLVTVAGDPVVPLGIVTKQYADLMLPLVGGTMSGGLSFGAQVGGSNSDISRHLILHTSGYGFGVTAARLNAVVAVSGTFVAVVGGTDRLAVSNTAVTATVPVTLPADPTTALQAATKQYADKFLPLTGGTVTGNLNFGPSGAVNTFCTVGNAVTPNLQLNLNGAAGVNRGLMWQSATTSRWQIIVNGAEGGSNAGGNMQVIRYDDTGANMGNALTLIRSNGAVVIGGPVGFNGVAAPNRPAITGSRAGNAALASLLTQLASTGLITDSTTA